MLATMTMPGTFWFYSAVALIGAVILYFVLPETEGRTLIEIERYFVSGTPLSPTTSLAPIAHVVAQTALGCSVTQFQDHIVSKSPENGGMMGMKTWEGRRLFQLHLDEHRIRLDGHKHDHANGEEDGDLNGSALNENNLPPRFEEINFTPPHHRRQEGQQTNHQQSAYVAAISEMTHL